MRSISTGLTATEDDKINCDNVEDIGRSIQLTLDNVCVESATIKKSDQVKTLDDLRPQINIDNKTVHVDPLILFARLTVLLQREYDATDKFNFEFTAEPTSFFKDGMRRKPNKVLLRNTLLDKVDPVINIQANACVIDGGALLHKVKWEAKGTFKDVGNKYINFLKPRCGYYDTITVVFDGYNNKTSIKTQEHVR